MLKNFYHTLKNKTYSQKTIPIALFATAVIAFGLLIPELGFYWDDWERILVLKLYGANAFWDYFSTKRPFAAWVYFLFGPILGGNPIGWHVLSLAARWLAAVCFWWVLRNLWPSHKRQAFYASALFLVYPIFLQQSIIVYFKHWLAYSFYFLSLGLTIQGVRKPQNRWAYFAGAVFTELLHLSLLEYFAGLELLRPLVIYLVLKDKVAPVQKALRRSLGLWLPYLLVLALYAAWRLSFGANLEDNPYSPQLLSGLLANPFLTLRSLVNIGLQDAIYIFVSSWHKTLKPGVISLDAPFSLLSWGIAFILAAMLAFYMLRLKDDGEPSLSADRWTVQAFILGLLAAFLGALPVWVTFRAVSIEGMFTDRFAMACMAGASLSWVAFLEWLVGNPRRRLILLNILILVGVSLQLRTANDFRWSWILQQRIYWQLYWRAPYIQPNTTILTDGQLFPYVMPQFSFNLLYREPQDYGKGGYVFSYLGDFGRDQGNWLNGKDLEIKYLFFDFRSSTKNSLVIFKEDRTSNCLWILDEEDKDNPYLPDLVRQALPLSNLTRIDASAKAGQTPPEDVFGAEPEQGWCYYYEKADLAYQYGDYEEAAALADDAIAQGFTPASSQANSPQEWMPILESYAAVGRWQEAMEITETGMRVDQNYRPMFCSTWQRIENRPQTPPEGKPFITEMYNFLDCSPYLNE